MLLQLSRLKRARMMEIDMFAPKEAGRGSAHGQLTRRELNERRYGSSPSRSPKAQLRTVFGTRS